MLAKAVPHFLRYEEDDVREVITATSKLDQQAAPRPEGARVNVEMPVR